jgi:hypothetical protein
MACHGNAGTPQEQTPVVGWNCLARHLVLLLLRDRHIGLAGRAIAAICWGLKIACRQEGIGLPRLSTGGAVFLFSGASYHHVQVALNISGRYKQSGTKNPPKRRYKLSYILVYSMINWTEYAVHHYLSKEER